MLGRSMAWARARRNLVLRNHLSFLGSTYGFPVFGLTLVFWLNQKNPRSGPTPSSKSVNLPLADSDLKRSYSSGRTVSWASLSPLRNLSDMASRFGTTVYMTFSKYG